MKLVDILARELTAWPDDLECAHQDHDGEIRFYGGKEETIRFDFMAQEKAHDRGVNRKSRTGSRITRAEWQAAVDALNQSELDAVLAKNEQLAAARAERIQAWNGEGLPPVGAICEVLWNESRVEYLRTKVFGVNEHGQPIHRFDEGPKKYQYQADVLRTASGTQVFRPIRTAEQVAAEEREKEIADMMEVTSDGITCMDRDDALALYKAGYRKQVAK